MSTVNTLWISENTYSLMVGLAIKSYPNETGGLLIGYESEDAIPVVTAIVGPGPKARHRRYKFMPDAEYQEAALAAHHAATNGAESYLGDWHTHPDGRIALSSRDMKTLRIIAAAPDAYLSRPLMAILAPGGKNWDAGAFRLNGWTRRLLFYRHDITRLEPRFFPLGNS